MAATINIPAAGENAQVRVNGSTQTICATGTASRAPAQYPTAIWAMLYQSNPTLAPSPPGGATQGTVYSDNQWKFRGTQEIPGATSGDAEPYPENWLVVWAQYDNDGTPSYDSAGTYFYGQASTRTDCDS